LLRFKFYDFIIEQKDILLNFRMNLYSRHIGRAASFSWDKSNWLKMANLALSDSSRTAQAEPQGENEQHQGQDREG